ncbi:MAG TPA: flavin reductase [Candidatus Avipropionibacterium avicola]|uniref:Flavin reductase n=1 Tax=Candidatus Avipropionibacterium avicola TaxID=2840701 RepID=A0A9D1GVF5_9ACTN|nr:flavin reductase [Candidatus Avipropionibacterium avicola]
MTIHADHPFADPPGSRRELRRLRGRWPSGVAVWTSPSGTVASRNKPVGLTVSSMVFADGEPGEVLALLDPDSELAEALESDPRATVSLLPATARDVAEVFAGLAPAPGGPFTVGQWEERPYGPALVDAVATVAVEVVERQPDVGWSTLVRARLAEPVAFHPDDPSPLIHLHGGYPSL